MSNPIREIVELFFDNKKVGAANPLPVTDSSSSTVLGATTDAAVTGDTPGTMSAKLRGIGKILADVWVSASHWIKVAIATALPAGEAHIGEVSKAGGVRELALTLDTNIYAASDLLSDTVELVNAVRVSGGSARLESLTVLDESDQGQPLTILILRSSVSLGTVNNPVNVSDENGREILANIPIYAGDFKDLGACRIATPPLPVLPRLQPTTGTSLFVATVSDGTGTYSANGIRIKFGLAQE